VLYECDEERFEWEGGDSDSFLELHFRLIISHQQASCEREERESGDLQVKEQCQHDWERQCHDTDLQSLPRLADGLGTGSGKLPLMRDNALLGVLLFAVNLLNVFPDTREPPKVDSPTDVSPFANLRSSRLRLRCPHLSRSAIDVSHCGAHNSIESTPLHKS
jgi:hypothetical protein